jgi:hypothetical protein
MASSWGSSWGSAWGNSWGATVPAPIVIQQPSGGGRRIPNKYEPLDLRRARWRYAKRKLDEERKRLAELKKQQRKVEVQYKAITLSLPELTDGGNGARGVIADRAHVLEQEMKEFVERVALQNAAVRALRKEAELAQKETDRQADEREMQEAYAAFQESERVESERVEALRVQQEADDEMEMVLLLIHDDL